MLVVVTMSEKLENVVLRVEVPEQFRTRLKTQAVRMRVTMGEMIQKFMEEPLEQLELESIQTTGNEPETFKDLVRQKYFELMSSGKIGHQRLKELSFGQKPTAKERQLISQTLEVDSLPED